MALKLSPENESSGRLVRLHHPMRHVTWVYGSPKGDWSKLHIGDVFIILRVFKVIGAQIKGLQLYRVAILTARGGYFFINVREEEGNLVLLGVQSKEIL